MTQKEKTFLDQTAQRLHLTVDGESSILFGSVGGYQTMLRRNDQGLAVMTLSLHKLGQEPDQSAIRQFVKGTRLVTGFSVRRSRVELTLNVRFGNPNQVEKLAEAVAAVVEFLHASGYDNCCQNCGSAVETDPTIRCDLQRKVKGDRRIVLIYAERQLVTLRDRVYIIQG